MKFGLLRRFNKKTGKFNAYRHLIFYRINKDETMNIKMKIPLFFI